MTIKKTVLLMTCMAIFFLVHTVSAQEHLKYKDKQIEELSRKFFYYSEEDGKESLTLTETPAKYSNHSYCDTGCCEDTLAKLGSESAALSIPGTSLILALLDCPINCSETHDSVVAIFDRKNLNVPVCFSQLDLMQAGGYYYGSVRSLKLRKAPNGAFYVVVTLGGADGGDHWESFLFLHMDMNCTTTLLSKLYASHGITHNAGTIIAYHFVNDTTVEVTTDHLIGHDDEKGYPIETSVKTTSKRFNLEDLYNNPQSRVFPSEAEKSLALFKNGADPNSRDENGKTLFMWIAEERPSWAVKAILTGDIDSNAKSKDGHTVLMSAAQGGDPKLLAILLGDGADVNTKDDNGRTALLTATEAAHRLSLEVLLDKGADINAGTKNGLTALMAAVKKGLWGRDSIVEFLIKRGADVNAKDDEGKTVLMHAVERFHVELVKTLIEKGADVNSRSNDGSTALKLAQKKRHNKVIVELLKAHGAND
jgi:hypothetical protein